VAALHNPSEIPGLPGSKARQTRFDNKWFLPKILTYNLENYNL
jgi:hypothetical protein